MTDANTSPGFAWTSERAEDADEAQDTILSTATPDEDADTYITLTSEDSMTTGRGKTRSRATATGTPAKLVRGVLDKYRELVDASDADRRALALALGGRIKPDADDLTVAVMSAPRVERALLDRLDTITAADDAFDAMEAVVGLDAAESRRVWNLMAEFGVVNGPAPANPAKVIARTAIDNAGDLRERTERIRQLTRK